jgi:hypothetical protein
LRALALAVPLGLTILLAQEAAAEAPLVIIVRDAEGAPTASRVESELADLGISVRTLVIGADAAADEPLSAIGERTGAAAAVRIRADRTIEVWAAGDPAAEAVIANAPSGDGDRLIAIAAAELVRARMLHVPPEAAPAEPIAQPARAETTTPEAEHPAAPAAAPVVAEAIAAPAPRRARITAEVGPATLASGLDLAPTFNAFFAVAIFAVKPLSVELFGAAPIVPSRAANAAGSMRMHTALAGGGLRFGIESSSGRFLGLAAPGFAALILVLDGHAADGYDARGDTIATAAPLLRLAGSVRLAARVRLGLDAIAGVALSEVAVRIGGRRIASVGRPILGAALCVEVILW